MKKTIKSVMLLSAALLFNNFCADAQWVLTGNPTATNTSILGATGANINLRLFAGGSAAANERIHIVGSSGNVGIATTAPSAKLHVVGTTRLQGATTVVGLTTTTTLKVTGGSPGLNKILRSDAAGLASWITNPVGTNTTNMVPKWNGTQLVTGTIFDNGNIGIGTTIPATKLNVSGGNYDLFSSQGDVKIGNATYSLRMGVALAGGGAGDAYVSSVGGTNRLFLGSGGTFEGTQMMAITGSGVGIGNVAPANRLAVVGDATSANPVVQVNNSYVGSSDVRGISSYSKAADGWGYGIEATGGYKGGSFNADAGAYTGSSYGVIASAFGSAGSHYGVYGSASGGTDDWGGYFPTKTYTNELRVGGTQGATGYVAAINGKLIATEVRVALQSSWPDYVFGNDYSLMSIQQLEENIKANNHLPGLPSACEVEENGIHLGEMQTKIVEKLEESHLYIIQLQKQIDELKAQVNELKK